MEKMRLTKYIAVCGNMTRKEAGKAVRSGRVLVDHAVVVKEGQKVSADQEICLDGVVLRWQKYRYIMMNKPAGVLSATKDGSDRTVLDLLEGERQGLFPVGRLDKDSEGLLLLTDHGLLAHRILSPKFHVEKKYQVWYEGELAEDAAEQVRAGIDIGEKKKTGSGRLELVEPGQAFLTISEGKFHQVKRMIANLGGSVTRLKRISMAGIPLDAGLFPGDYRRLAPEEVALLMEKAHMEDVEPEGGFEGD